MRYTWKLLQELGGGPLGPPPGPTAPGERWGLAGAWSGVGVWRGEWREWGLGSGIVGGFPALSLRGKDSTIQNLSGLPQNVLFVPKGPPFGPITCWLRHSPWCSGAWGVGRQRVQDGVAGGLVRWRETAQPAFAIMCVSWREETSIG